ncbi:MAG: hypothetical protein AAF485_08870 [Chloroflexota bacterium]
MINDINRFKASLFILITIFVLTSEGLTTPANAETSSPLSFVSETIEAPALPPAQEVGTSANQTITYSYDGTGRLIKVEYGSKAIDYNYDSSGNLIKSQVGQGAGFDLYLPVLLKNS